MKLYLKFTIIFMLLALTSIARTRPNSDYGIRTGMMANSAYGFAPKDDKRPFEPGKFNQVITNIGIDQGWRTMGQVGIGLADTKFKFRGFFPLWYFRQIQVGSQFNFSAEKPVLGPFIAYDATSNSKKFGTYFGYGASVIYFTNVNEGALYVSPRLGIRMLAVYNIMLGYNIPVYGDEMKPYVNRFSVNVTFMLFRRANVKSISQ